MYVWNKIECVLIWAFSQWEEKNAHTLVIFQRMYQLKNIHMKKYAQVYKLSFNVLALLVKFK